MIDRPMAPTAAGPYSRPDRSAEAAKWVDGTDACKLLGISRTHIYKLIHRGTIKAYRVGAMTIYWREDVEAAAAARRLWDQV